MPRGADFNGIASPYVRYYMQIADKSTFALRYRGAALCLVEEPRGRRGCPHCGRAASGLDAREPASWTPRWGGKLSHAGPRRATQGHAGPELAISVGRKLTATLRNGVVVAPNGVEEGPARAENPHYDGRGGGPFAPGCGAGVFKWLRCPALSRVVLCFLPSILLHLPQKPTPAIMAYPEKFTGFQSPSADKWLEFEKNQWAPRPFGEHDVDIQIECCGVCASDKHCVSGDWGGAPYPLAVGHEVVGKVLRVGDKVTLAKVGQRVGVGAQVWSCGDCRQCKNDNETYCKHQVDAYGAKYPGAPETFVTQGGYSSHTRIHEYWYVNKLKTTYRNTADFFRVYPIPEAMASSDAAPMLCAGITVYSPLKRFGAGPGKKVGVVGIGGLGHYAVLFAKALGAETWAISRSRAKEADAKKMGADGFLATSEKAWNEPHKTSFDLIINTANSFDGFELSEYLSLLDVHGRWNSVGLPGGEGIKINNFDFISNGCFIGTSHLGSRREMLEMLDMAASKGIKSWVEEIPISREGLQKAMDKLQKSSVRYRSCMVGYDKAFGA